MLLEVSAGLALGGWLAGGGWVSSIEKISCTQVVHVNNAVGVLTVTLGKGRRSAPPLHPPLRLRRRA